MSLLAQFSRLSVAPLRSSLKPVILRSFTSDSNDSYQQSRNTGYEQHRNYERRSDDNRSSSRGRGGRGGFGERRSSSYGGERRSYGGDRQYGERRSFGGDRGGYGGNRGGNGGFGGRGGRSEAPRQPREPRQQGEMKPRGPWRLSPKPEDCRQVWVGSLSFEATEDDLMSAFEKCGQVVNIRIARNRDGRSRGFAHVEFESPEAVDEAVKLQEAPIAGRNIVVDYAGSQPQQDEGGRVGQPQFERGSRGGGRGGRGGGFSRDRY